MLLQTLNNQPHLNRRAKLIKSLVSIALLSIPLSWEVNAQNNSSYYPNTESVDGDYNTAFGWETLKANTTGGWNTAIGTFALRSNVIGDCNTAIGYKALYSNLDHFNTATGYMALLSTVTGEKNVAHGYKALHLNTAIGNVAFGSAALSSNTNGSFNVAVGYHAFYLNAGGTAGVAVGNEALNNSTGNGNTAVGSRALRNNTDGYGNTALGNLALSGVTSGDYNTGLGAATNVTLGSINGSTAIGQAAIVNASNKIRLGAANNVTAVEGTEPFSAVQDDRFSFDVKASAGNGLNFIKKLRPVEYNFDTKKFQDFVTSPMDASLRSMYLEGDFGSTTAVRHNGFIAQEVEKAANETGYHFSGLIKPENEYDNYSLAYSLFVVPLVEAIQEQEIQIENRQKLIDELRELVNELLAVKASMTSTSPENVASEEQDISIYSNPNKGTFTVHTNTIDRGTLEVMNLSGIVVHSATLKNGVFSYEVDLSQRSPTKGEYLVIVTSDSTKITKRMVIE